MTKPLPPQQDKAPLTAADMIAPGCGCPTLLTRSPTRLSASAADLAPAAPRPHSDDALAHASRIGNHLHHRDGRITDLNGHTLKPALNQPQKATP